MSVDLEDNYCDMPFSTWSRFDSRILITTKLILDLFDKYDVKATFFTVGYVAQKHPGLIEKIRSKGHEIASHGFSHSHVSDMDEQRFEMDLIKSRDVLEKLAGEKVLGFRSPYFISGKQTWVFRALKKYHRYDSSVFPVGPHYNFQSAPRHIYRVSDSNPLEEDPDSNFMEIPMATLRLPIVGQIPIAGGFHMWFLPYEILKLGVNQLNNDGYSAMLYVHPEDLHPKRAHLPGYAWHYFWGLNGARKKFEALLRNFKFSSVREVLKL
jgi:polysaccharide deacetylase family protein (PEP-CTERM system associated)